ncbi:MAG: IPExxxVDY family protein [Bacteroidota bacterium]
MATIHKISDELFVDTFDLIAIHGNFEPYAMAYHLNKVLHLNFKRTRKDLEIGSRYFTMYTYRNDIKALDWYLISNKVTTAEKEQGTGLFETSRMVYKMHHLIEEHKEVDFLLKLYPGDDHESTKAIEAIRAVAKASMVYAIETDNLKSKINLIF